MNHNQDIFDKIKEKIRAKVLYSMTYGGVLFLNIDDSQLVVYFEIYEPDIQEFFGATVFPCHLLNLKYKK